MNIRTLRIATFPLGLLVCAGPASAEPGKPLKIVEDFEKGAARWKPTAPENWKVVADRGGEVFDLFNKAATYKPPHRSPFNFALLDGVRLGDFTITAKVKATVKSYGHRDVVVVFGHQDPARFYYVHFGEKADDHSCQVFIVNNAARTKISTKETNGIPWKDETWHTIKVVRKTSDGTVKVYFDDMEKTVLEARDTTFTGGQIGIGSFDDTARFDDITIEGTEAGESAGK
jgi:hypothetical protein